MAAKHKRVAAAAAVFILLLLAWHLSSAQLEGLEGMEPPDDVTGIDCSMCHGDFAAQYTYTHEPAVEGNCVACHLTTGEGGHGGLVAEDRSLCLSCHVDKEAHYPLLNCWAASCHADKHGSDVDEYFNPSRKEEYPGFTAATAGAAYVGSDTCLGCHTDKCEWWQDTAHSMSDTDEDTPLKLRGCEGCHGPGDNHWGRWARIGDFELAGVEETDTVCLKCHKDEMFTPDYWDTLHPLAGVSCNTCHNPHNLTNKNNLCLPPNELCLSCHETKRADFNRLSHHPVDMNDPRTGMLCVDCHSPHGAEGRPMLKLPAEELCASCHVDKAGPFAFPHAGYDPALGEGCFTCHSAHGSNTPNLLRLNGRGVCLQCHTDQLAHGGATTCWTMGCHTEHHGSNSSYFFFN
jgi:DmsE family decaheme c-type cytochrome